MTTEIVTVPFRGDDLIAVRDDGGLRARDRRDQEGEGGAMTFASGWASKAPETWADLLACHAWRKDRTAVLLLSGGMDSTICAHLARFE